MCAQFGEFWSMFRVSKLGLKARKNKKVEKRNFTISVEVLVLVIDLLCPELLYRWGLVPKNYYYLLLFSKIPKNSQHSQKKRGASEKGATQE